MKIYKTQSEVEKDIKNGVLEVEGDVKFECSISISASIRVIDGNITAWNITAGNITAGNITAGDITAWNITAGDILYYAFCCAYDSIKCLSIKGTRGKHQEPVCLDGKLEIKTDTKPTNKVKIKVASGQILEGEIVEENN